MSLTSPLLLLVTLPLISFLLAQISVFTLPVGVTDAIAQVFSYLSTLDFVLPITAVATLLPLALVFETLLIVFKAGMWIVRHIRGAN